MLVGVVGLLPCDTDCHVDDGDADHCACLVHCAEAVLSDTAEAPCLSTVFVRRGLSPVLSLDTPPSRIFRPPIA